MQTHSSAKPSGKPSARALHTLLMALPRLGITCLGLLLNAVSAQETSAPAPAHHVDGKFRNIYGTPNQHSGLWPYLRMRYFEEDFPTPDAASAPMAATPDLAAIANPETALQMVWIGHASTLVQIKGKNFLTDPVFQERASPVQMFGNRRYSPPGLQLAQLPPIDFVLISHNHYDHLERATVERIGNSAHWLVPLGLKSWFNKLGVERVTELDWWGTTQIDGVQFTLTPSQHWSRRGMFDTNATLWGSWAFEYAGQRVWFGGDTGYAEQLFKEIGQRLGPFDLALIPIGGYGPRWFMREKHADPDDAVRMHQDIRALNSVGIHWGTFVLTSEPVDEPPRLLAQARARHQVSEDAFITLMPGEMLLLPAKRQTASAAKEGRIHP